MPRADLLQLIGMGRAGTLASVLICTHHFLWT